jgi:hypothetical protein
MKHPSSRDLYAYWNERRGNRDAPERGDIDPAAIRHVLGDTFVLEIDRSLHYRFRLAGTRLCALFADELKGESFFDLWQHSAQAELRELLDVVAGEKIGVVASATGAPLDDRVLAVPIELLLLPLNFRSRGEARMLGALAPMTAPYWLGAKAIGPLTLGVFRHLGTGIDGEAAPRVVSAAGRLRSGLTVYDGGRAD